MALTKVIGNGLGAVTQDGAATFNESSADVDFRIESNSNANMFFVDAGNDKIGINTNAPNKMLSIENGDVQIHETGSSDPLIQFSVGNTQASPTQSYSLRIDNSDSDKFQLINGTSGAVALSVDTTGAITKPLQPAFLARMSAVQSNVAVNSNVQLNFASEIFDQNSDYNNSTSVFTAPVTGRYQFSFILRVDALDAAADYYSFFLDTSNRSDMRYLFNPDIGTTAGQDVDRFPALLSMLVDMDAGDTAKVQVYQANGSAQTDIISDSYFSGYLVA